MKSDSLKEFSVRLGRNIQNFREKKKLSQETLAEKAEISRTYLAYIETGSRIPSLKVLHTVADILGVKVGDLIPF